MHCLESDVACGVCLCLCRPSWSTNNANDGKMAKTVLGAGTNLRPHDVSIWLRRLDTQTGIHWWQMATMFNINLMLSQQSLHQMVNWLCARRDWEQRRGETSEERWLGGQKVAVGAIWLLDGPMCTHTWFCSGWWVLWGSFLAKIDKVEALDQRRSHLARKGTLLQINRGTQLAEGENLIIPARKSKITADHGKTCRRDNKAGQQWVIPKFPWSRFLQFLRWVACESVGQHFSVLLESESRPADWTTVEPGFGWTKVEPSDNHVTGNNSSS